jgi:hypothetical protein
MDGARYKNIIKSDFIYPALKERIGIAQDKLKSTSEQTISWVNDISAKLNFD